MPDIQTPSSSAGETFTEDAIEVAREYGIDISLLDYLLSLTPLERLQRHDQMLELIRAARAAGREYYGFDPRTATQDASLPVPVTRWTG